jgi:hypothetical protein
MRLLCANQHTHTKRSVATHSVSGLIGSGKSTIATFLNTTGYRSVSFAGPLKDIVSWLFNLPRDMLEGDTRESREWREVHNERIGMTPRKVLQLFGTEVGRHADVEVWTRALVSNATGKIVVTDARFSNELELLHSMGIITLCVVRGTGGSPGAHVSETSHQDFVFDHTIDNNGTLTDLRSATSHVMFIYAK